MWEHLLISILTHVVFQMPHSILKWFYTPQKLRGYTTISVIAANGVTINRKLAELEIRLSVNTKFPVELTYLKVEVFWGHTHYFTTADSSQRALIKPYNETALPVIGKALTPEEQSRIEPDTDACVLSGLAQFKTDYTSFECRFENLQSRPTIF